MKHPRDSLSAEAAHALFYGARRRRRWRKAVGNVGFGVLLLGLLLISSPGFWAVVFAAGG